MSDADAQDHRPSTPLMEAVLLEDEAEAYRWAKELLEAGEDPNQLDLMYQEHPISEAWSSDRIELIKLLLEYGARPALIHDEPFERTMCFKLSSIESILLLLDHGLTLDHEYQRSEAGEKITYGSNLLTALLLAGQMEKVDTLKSYNLLDHINVFAMDDGGDAPLGVMAREGNLELGGWLLKHGADINASSQNLIGYTALDRAVQNHDVRMVEFLLNHGANPNIPTWMWITALDKAIQMDGRNPKRNLEHPPSEYTDAVYKLVLAASTKFPPPTYPDGHTPEVWPPTHNNN